MNQRLDTRRTIMARTTEAKYEPARQGDIRHSFADIDKLEKIGYRPKFVFDNGLKKTVELFVSSKSCVSLSDNLPATIQDMKFPWSTALYLNSTENSLYCPIEY